MSDDRKTKRELLEELAALRTELGRVRGSGADYLSVEEAFKESEARLRQIIDLVPHMIFAKDWDGRFLLANKAVAEAYGTSVEKLTGSRHADHHKDQSELEHMLSDDREVMRDGVPKFIPQESFVDAHGKRRVLQTIKIPYRVFGKDEPAVLGVALDITERTRAEEERKRFESRIQQARKQESLAAFASGLAHDFNELVMNILDNAALARALRAPTQGTSELVENIERAARRAADLTNQLLVYSGQVRFEVCALFLNRLVEDTAHVLEAIASDRAELRFAFSDEPVPIMADAGRMRQIVMNLVTNAAEAIGKTKGVITISTGVVTADRADLTSPYVTDELPEGDYAFLEVADNGSGMNAEEQAKIFDPFFSQKFTGGGLGLAAVLGAVRGHKGTVKVDSAPGEGTTIRILLPTPPIVPFSNLPS